MAWFKMAAITWALVVGTVVGLRVSSPTVEIKVPNKIEVGGAVKVDHQVNGIPSIPKQFTIVVEGKTYVVVEGIPTP
jgi:hypothetical protein